MDITGIVVGVIGAIIAAYGLHGHKWLTLIFGILIAVTALVFA